MSPSRQDEMLRHTGYSQVSNIIITIYYIKVSGMASGNKLIKMIRYPHM